MRDPARAHRRDSTAQLVSLLNERAACALAIGRLKELAGLPMYQPARRGRVLRRRARRQRRSARRRRDRRLFERIIDEARRLERLAAAAGATGRARTANARMNVMTEGGAGRR